MKIRFRYLFLYFLLISSYSFPTNLLIAQTTFNDVLNEYVRKKYAEAGQGIYERERFLVGLIHNTNEELRTRIGDIGEAKEKYNESLQSIQTEVRRLKSQFGGPGNYLYDTAETLDREIDKAISDGVVNHSQKMAFEDGLQLLTMAAQNPGKPVDQLKREQSAFEHLESMKKALSGEGGTIYSPAVQRGDVSVYSLYKEWKKTYSIEYLKRLIDVKEIRKNLLESGTSLQKQQMLQRELQVAYANFNRRNYDYCSRLLEEILDTFKNAEPKDDILFYLGESYFAYGENLNALEKAYKPIMNSYPGSGYIADVYMRAAQIAYNFKDFAEVHRYAQKFFDSATSIHRGMEDVLLLDGIALARNDNYTNAIEILTKINNSSPYYFLAQLISANLYAINEQYDQAQQIYQRILSSNSVPIVYRDQAVAYSGLAYFQAGQYDRAMVNLKEISPEYSDFDMVLMGLAWSDYKKNMRLEKSKRDFTKAQRNAQFLLDNIFGSEYELEAKSLIAQMTELSGNVDYAVEQYSVIERYGAYRTAAGNYVDEREHYRQLLKNSEEVMDKALEHENQSAYEKAASIAQLAKSVLYQMTYSDFSTVGGINADDMQKIKRQVKEAEARKIEAEELQDEAMAEEAEKELLRLYKKLNAASFEIDSEYGVNYFEATPVAKLEAEQVNNNRMISDSRNYIAQEKEILLQKRRELENKLAVAKRNKDYKTEIYTGIYLEEINDIIAKMDRLATAANIQNMQDVTSNVHGWADFGAYGVVNSRIMEKESYSNAQANYSMRIDDLNEMLGVRKSRIENRIFRINEEVALMTRKVKEQRRRREREEKFREFEESYFDHRESETEIEGTGTEIQDQEGDTGGIPIQDNQPQIEDQPLEIQDEAPAEPIIDQAPQEDAAPSIDDLQKELENLPGGSDDE